MITHKVITSPVGVLTLVADEGILAAVRLGTPAGAPGPGTGYGIAAENGFEQAERQLAEYFDGTRCCFSIASSPRGTEFQRSVWQQVGAIAYGRTVSYKQLAILLGDAAKARSVGAALSHNPLNIVVPTHRVVGSRGALIGYSGGVEAKRYLLDLERSAGTEDLRRSCLHADRVSGQECREPA